jgi:predicted patatin/cPLA2 family phospholipase
MTATTGQIVSIRAMEKEHKRISAKANRYKREVDEAINIGNEFIAIHNELAEIINEKSRDYKSVLKKINDLQDREKRAQKILDRDICELTEKQVKAEHEANSLASEIYYAKLRAGMNN